MLSPKTGVLLVATACFSYVLFGCDSGNRDLTPTPESMPKQQAGADTGGPMAQEPPPKVLPIKEAQAAYDKAKTGSDEKAKLEATMNLADAYMWGDAPQKVKYRNALQYYREALKLDPKNEKAQQNADLIVSIYKQMGRPIPGGG